MPARGAPGADGGAAAATANNTTTTTPTTNGASTRAAAAADADDAKLIFGTVFSLRNMVRKLGGDDDAFISYRTGQYKLHYYETAANLRFALLTEPGAVSMRSVLHQIYINLWIEYGECTSPGPPPGAVAVAWPRSPRGARDRQANGERKGMDGLADAALACAAVVKNPLSPVEHKGGAGVRNEMFEMGLDKFIRGLM